MPGQSLAGAYPPVTSARPSSRDRVAV